MQPEDKDPLTEKVLAAAYRVHTTLGPGLLENAYTACLVFELRKAGLDARTEVPLPLVYDGVKLADVGYRIDILVNDQLIIEVKSLEAIAPVHKAQLVSYLKLANFRRGLLINFNVASLKEGITRRVNGY
jgi:GxxExxY protein